MTRYINTENLPPPELVGALGVTRMSFPYCARKDGVELRRRIEKPPAGEELRCPIREDTVFVEVGRAPGNIRKLAVVVKGTDVRVAFGN